MQSQTKNEYSKKTIIESGKFEPDIGFYIENPADAITGYTTCMYRKGRYKKINDLIVFTIDIHLIYWSFDAGQAYVCITNLPFLPAQEMGYTTCSYRLINSGFFSAMPVCYINQGLRNIVLGYTNFLNLSFIQMPLRNTFQHDNCLKENTEFHLSGHYFTDE